MFPFSHSHTVNASFAHSLQANLDYFNACY